MLARSEDRDVDFPIEWSSMDIDELYDSLAALNSMIEELLNTRAPELSKSQKKDLADNLEMILNYLKEL